MLSPSAFVVINVNSTIGGDFSEQEMVSSPKWTTSPPDTLHSADEVPNEPLISKQLNYLFKVRSVNIIKDVH